jgi:hypothetical protein
MQGIGATYQVTLPIYGDTSIGFDTEALSADVYENAKAMFYRDLPLVAVGLFAIVVVGTVVANRLIPPRI